MPSEDGFVRQRQSRLIVRLKCNGLQPCNTCSKRSTSCKYGASENGSDEDPSPKRRMIDQSGTARVKGFGDVNYQPSNTDYIQQSQQWIAQDNGPSPNSVLLQKAGLIKMETPSKIFEAMFANDGTDEQDIKNKRLEIPEPEADLVSQATSLSGHEEAIVESNPRLLEDPTGRLCE
jgi:hypothetical protein